MAKRRFTVYEIIDQEDGHDLRGADSEIEEEASEAEDNAEFSSEHEEISLDEETDDKHCKN